MNDETSRRDRNFEVIREEIQIEMDSIWARKVSLESRAFAVFTLNLAIATLYLAIRSQANLDTIYPGKPSFVVLIITFIVMGASTVLAILVALPGRWPGLGVPALDKLVKKSGSSPWPYDYVFAKAKLKRLERAREANQLKAKLMIASFITSGATLITFAVVIAFNWAKA
jgi:hypothetical protein